MQCNWGHPLSFRECTVLHVRRAVARRKPLLLSSLSSSHPLPSIDFIWKSCKIKLRAYSVFSAVGPRGIGRKGQSRGIDAKQTHSTTHSSTAPWTGIAISRFLICWVKVGEKKIALALLSSFPACHGHAHANKSVWDLKADHVSSSSPERWSHPSLFLPLPLSPCLCLQHLGFCGCPYLKETHPLNMTLLLPLDNRSHPPSYPSVCCSLTFSTYFGLLTILLRCVLIPCTSLITIFSLFLFLSLPCLGYTRNNNNKRIHVSEKNTNPLNERMVHWHMTAAHAALLPSHFLSFPFSWWAVKMPKWINSKTNVHTNYAKYKQAPGVSRRE